MKPLHIVGVITLFALIIGGVYYSSTTSQVTKKDTSPTTENTTSSITVYRETGDIAWKNEGDATYTPITKDSASVQDRASVKTGAGRGYVMFPDNSSIALSPNTEIVITYSPKKVSILQLLGSTYHRVQSLTTGNEYEVRTPNTLAAIRGTKLAVTYNPDTKKTFVAVTEHKVAVTKVTASGTMETAPVIIQQGSLAEVRTEATSTQGGKTGGMMVQKSDNVIEMKGLIAENKPIDQMYDTQPDTSKKEFMVKMITTLQAEPAETDAASRINSVMRAIKKVQEEIKSDTTSKPTETSQENKNTTVLVDTKADVKPALETNVVPKVITKETVTVPLKTFVVSGEDFTPEQQNFIDTFYTTYERLFSFDDPATFCKAVSISSGSDLVAQLETVTRKAGYVLPNKTELLSFATELVASCKDGSIRTKAVEFKTRFDTAYPF